MLLFALQSVVSNWVLTAGGVIAQIDKTFCTDWSEDIYTKLLCHTVSLSAWLKFVPFRLLIHER